MFRGKKHWIVKGRKRITTTKENKQEEGHSSKLIDRLRE